jgi:hypothetical protein
MRNAASDLSSGLFGALMSIGLSAQGGAQAAPRVRLDPRIAQNFGRAARLLAAEKETTRALRARVAQLEAEVRLMRMAQGRA